MNWLADLQFTAAESVLFGLCLTVIIYAICGLVVTWATEPQIVQVRPRTVVEFPPQPTHFLRDVETDALWDVSTAGMLRHYSAKTIEAMRKGEHAAGYARMTASLAFRLHPELRLPAPPPIQNPNERGRDFGRRTTRPINVEVIH